MIVDNKKKRPLIGRFLFLLFVGCMALSLVSCDSNDSLHDLSAIGKGQNVIVQIHDPN